MAIQSCHRYPSIRRQVNMRIRNHRLRLLAIQSRKAIIPTTVEKKKEKKEREISHQSSNQNISFSCSPSPNALYAPSSEHTAPVLHFFIRGTRHRICCISQFDPTKTQKKKKFIPMFLPEHSDLIHNMIPRPRCLQLLHKQPTQLLSHADNAFCHRPDITLPLLKQFGVVEYERNLHSHTMHLSVKRFRVGARADGRSQPEGSETHQTRPMGRRVADLRPGEHRQLTLDPGGALLRRRHDMQRSDPLAVQSGVLREALS